MAYLGGPSPAWRPWPGDPGLVALAWSPWLGGPGLGSRAWGPWPRDPDLRVREGTEVRMYGCTDIRTYGCTDVWTYGCTDVRTHRRTDGQNIPCILQDIVPLGPLLKKETIEENENKDEVFSFVKMRA